MSDLSSFIFKFPTPHAITHYASGRRPLNGWLARRRGHYLHNEIQTRDPNTIKQFSDASA